MTHPSRGELLPLIRLAVPIVLANLANQGLGVIDTLMAGRLSPLGLAATGLGSTLFFVGSTLAMGIAFGVDPLTAQAFGAGRPREARITLWQGVWAVLLASVPGAGLVLGAGYSLEAMGVERTLAEGARDYLWWRLPSLPGMLVFLAARAYLQAAHRPRAVLIAVLAATPLNGAANWVLMYGDAGLTPLGLPALGLPAMGVKGIALASTLVTAFEVWIVSRAVSALDPGPGSEPLRAPRWATIRAIYALGLPLGGQLLAEGGLFALTGVLMAGIGTLATAAHHVALTVASFTFMVPLGIGSATGVQVGRAVGARDGEGTRRAGVAGIGLGAGFMAGSALVLWFAPGPIARLITNDPAVAWLAEDLLRVAGIFQLFDGVQVTASGALRGAGITRWTFVANLVCYWLIAFPISAGLGFGLGFGPAGLWWGLTVGLAAASVALTAKFRAATRRTIRALEAGAPA